MACDSYLCVDDGDEGGVDVGEGRRCGLCRDDGSSQQTSVTHHSCHHTRVELSVQGTCKRCCTGYRMSTISLYATSNITYLPRTMFSAMSSLTMETMLETLTLLMRPLMLFLSASHASRWYGADDLSVIDCCMSRSRAGGMYAPPVWCNISR